MGGSSTKRLIGALGASFTERLGDRKGLGV